MTAFNELPTSPTDAISSVAFSPDGSKLLVCSWDGTVNILLQDSDAAFSPHKQITNHAPVLGACWDSDNATIYAVGLDREVAKYHVEQGEESRRVLSRHRNTSNKVAYSPEHDIVISTSWDNTIHVHDPKSARYVPMTLPAKPFALALTADKAVVAMSQRQVYVYDLHALRTALEQAGATQDGMPPIESQPWQKRESSLKFMTRDIACMPDGTGFVASSIEGRVGVEWFGEEENKAAYAFKCHREKSTATSTNSDNEAEAKPIDIIYPVNAIAFHPNYFTFATGGGDGTVSLWDAKSKRRLKHYSKLPASVSALDFSRDGTMLAVGISPGFEDGQEEAIGGSEQMKVYVLKSADRDAKPKAGKDKSKAVDA